MELSCRSYFWRHVSSVCFQFKKPECCIESRHSNMLVLTNHFLCWSIVFLPIWHSSLVLCFATINTTTDHAPRALPFSPLGCSSDMYIQSVASLVVVLLKSTSFSSPLECPLDMFIMLVLYICVPTVVLRRNRTLHWQSSTLLEHSCIDILR